MSAALPPLCNDYLTPRELGRLHSFAKGLFPELDAVSGTLQRHLRELGGSAQKRTSIVTDHDVERACTVTIRSEPLAPHERLLMKVAHGTGARRAELRHARLCDLVPQRGGRLLLQIRSHGGFRLKTRSSRRSLPLHVLLDPGTLAELRHRVTALRSFRLPDDQVFLFADLYTPTEPPSDGAFQRISDALRRVTGDRALTFHNLRHSAINRFMALLLGHELPLLRTPPFPGMRADRWTARHRLDVLQTVCPELHQAPAGHLHRDWLFGLARLVGHSTPRTLLTHYHHLRPLFQWSVLERHHAVTWPLHLLDDVSGITSRTRQRTLKRHMPDVGTDLTSGEVAYLLWRDRYLPTPETTLAQATAMDGRVPQATVECPALATAQVPLVCQLHRDGHTPREIADILEIDLQAIMTIDAALQDKVEGGRYAPAMKPVQYLVHADRRHAFHELAQRLDAFHTPSEVHDAWARAIAVHKRWAWPRSTWVIEVVRHLLGVLPGTAMLILECQPLPHANPSGLIAERDALKKSLDQLDTRRVIWVDRQAHGTPLWRHRPAHKGSLYWYYLRIGKRDDVLRERNRAAHPDQTIALHERTTGYTAAADAWRMRLDLRVVQWSVKRHHRHLERRNGLPSGGDTRRGDVGGPRRLGQDAVASTDLASVRPS